MRWEYIFGVMGKVLDSHQPVTTWAEEDFVEIRHQATTSKDEMRRISMFYSELWTAWISERYNYFLNEL
jgi:hypothetical protein